MRYDPELLADGLRWLLKDRKMSQAALARLAHTTQSNISHFVTGRALPSVTLLCEICNVFDVSPNFFLKRTE